MQSRKRYSLDGTDNGHRKRLSPQKDRFSFGFTQNVKFEPNYPESFVSFADGIREDVSEMMAAGARVINQSLKVIFPFSSSSSSNTAETQASEETDLAAEYEEINKRRTDDMFKLKTVQTEDALRLRFPTKKIATKLAMTPPKQTANDENKTTNVENVHPPTNKDKKLLLDKLKDNPTIEAFTCADNKLLIIGNLRMIMAEKNNDKRNTARILWSQPYSDIANCGISCQIGADAKRTVSSRLDIEARSGAMMHAELIDAHASIQALQLIQTRCEPLTKKLPSGSYAASKQKKKTPMRLQAKAHLPDGTVITGSTEVINFSSPVSETPSVLQPISLDKIASRINEVAGADTNSTSTPAKCDVKSAVSASASKRYQRMLKAGVSPELVKKRMSSDGVDADCLISLAEHRAEVQQDKENSGISKTPKREAAKVTPKPPSPSPATDSITASNISTAKYDKMLKAGVPLEAVKMKMRSDGIDVSLLVVPAAAPSSSENNISAPKPAISKQDRLAKAGIPLQALQARAEAITGVRAPSSTPISAQIDAAPSTEQLPSHLKRFQIMMKSGVPEGAVLHKMTLEGISAEEQQLVVGKIAPAVAVPTALSNPSKLLGLHWDPLEQTSDASGSLWSEISDTGLRSEELSTLASIFGRQKKKPVEEVKSSRRKSVVPTMIDMSRSTNIAIGLSAFRQKKMTPEEICNAICCLNMKALDQDDLLRLLEILPTDTERKTLKNIKLESAHETEKFLYLLSNIDDANAKVQSMIFQLNFKQTIEHLRQALTDINQSCECIVSSQGLREVMKCVLAIGNSLNEGTRKGGAKGFRLASLLKLSQTKSADGKCTVLDYLVQMIHARRSTGDVDAEKAFGIDDELAIIHTAKKFSMLELQKDVQTLEVKLQKTSDILKAMDSEEKDTTDSAFHNLNAFVVEAETEIAEIRSLLTSTKENCCGVINFFGEDAEMPFTQVSQLLGDFLNALAASKDKIRRQQKNKK